MQLLGRLEIKSKEKIKEFLDKEHVGRIATIDQNGYPQIIPMNFVFLNDAIKGKGKIVNDKKEKTNALNGLMKKYQPEGRYEPISPEMQVLDEVAIIKVTPDMIRGKYKIGQNLQTGARREIAEKILERNSSSAKETLKIMGFTITEKGLEMTDEPVW